MNSTKKKILIVVEWFWPGYKAGGPIRSIAGFVYALGDHFDISIITRDRDLHADAPYKNIASNQWLSHKGVRICYVRPEGQIPFLIDLLRNEHFDSLYLNSFFSKHYSLKIYLLYQLGKIPVDQVVIAPRAEFTSERLAEKPWQKKFILAFVRATGYYKKAIWHATSDLEVASVKEQIGPEAKIYNTPNLVEVVEKANQSREKEVGKLNIVFLSRIVNYKNLLGVIDTLSKLELRKDQAIKLDIFGPIQDAGYWKQCEEVIAQLSPQLSVHYAGMIPHEEVLTTFGKYHLFFFPTWGENFGHVILEAMMAGTPVLLSDQTPWRNLEDAGVGWDIPLAETLAYQQAIQDALAWDQSTFSNISKAVKNFAHKHINTPTALQVYQELFA